MSDDQLGVKIVADASGVKPAVDLTKSEVQGLAPLLQQLNVSMSAMAQGMRAGFEQVAVAINGTKAEMKELEAETERETLSLRGMAASVHEGVESFNRFKIGLKEIAEVWIAAFAVERIIEFSKHLGEAAEKVFNLSQRLGTSVTDIQTLQAYANRTGGSVDTLAMATTRLDRAFQQAKSGNTQMREGLAALGINANGSYTQMQLLQTAMATFASMPDGPGKTALAYQTMGRAASQVIPTLNLTKEQQAELNKEIDEYGVKNAAAIASGMQLAEAWNTNKNAMLGLTNVMMESLGPVLTTLVSGFNDLSKAFIQSYQRGGEAKTVMDGLASTLKLIAEVMIELGADIVYTFKTIDAVSWELAAVITAALDSVIATVEITGQALVELGRVMYDLMSLRWGALADDFEQGMKRVTAVAKKAAGEVAKDWHDGMKNAADSMASADSQYLKAEAFLEKLDKAGTGPKPAMPEGHGTGTTDDMVVTPPKDKGPSAVEVWKAQLAEKLTAEQNWGADEAAFSLQFWESKLAEVKKGSKDEIQVRQEVSRAKMAVFKEEQQSELSTIRNTLSIKTDLAKADADLAKFGLQEKIEAIDEEQRAGVIGAAKAAALRADVNRQIYQLDIDLEDKEYQLKATALNAQLQLEHLKPKQREEINRQIELLEAQHLDRMAVLRAQTDQKIQKDTDTAADAVRAKWQSILNPMVTSFGNAMSGIISHTQTLRQAWQRIGQDMLSAAMGWAEKQVVIWVMGESRKTAATAAGAAIRTTTEAGAATATTGISALAAIKQIAHSAAVAAARVYASIAQIPVVGPFLAPAMAAAALYGVIKLGQSVFSAEGGMGEVQQDNAPFLLHRKEMVLPASIATPLRSMLQGGGAANLNASNAANDGRGGDNHFHFHDHTGTMTPSKIMENRSAIAKAVKQAHREGAFAGTGVAF
jgi:hypothetical protein